MFINSSNKHCFRTKYVKKEINLAGNAVTNYDRKPIKETNINIIQLSESCKYEQSNESQALEDQERFQNINLPPKLNLVDAISYMLSKGTIYRDLVIITF
ncbi:13108_t:CDS:2 [Dentiscutata erythropus]|uniref:13108_t:CDS:1 n=1 Tax=Dentiscutata erythropus TaxID=1348616 RepID=A0A9N8VH19_9GLOM|nr:13108_t:CDS:2 [Dentiscutata erythropus]